MSEVLLIDDDRIILKAVAKLIAHRLDLSVLTAESFEETKRLVEKVSVRLAICDYHLPDAEKGEAIDFLVEKKIPTIVLTGSYDEKLREDIINKGVVDYLVKGAPNIREEIISVVKRCLKNLNTTVLIVEDSLTDRKVISKILRNMLFNVMESGSIHEAREILKEPANIIKLIILDYYLPDEEALNFLYEIRSKVSKAQLGIIIVSGYIKDKMIPILLKAGANDFLKNHLVKKNLCLEFIIP